MNDRRRKILKLIARVSIFGSLSIILYMVPGLQFGLPFTPGFLKIHLDEIPVLLAGFAYGTPTAVALIVIKSIFKLITDIPETMGVGVLADFIYGCALCIPACLIYNYKRTFSGVIIGISVGLASNLIFSCIVGLYTIYPLYANIYGTQTIVNMFKVFDNSINSITDFKIAYEFLLPFNFIKDAIVILVTLLIYKPMRIIIERVEK
jgi:riboflavin transporter